MANGEMLGFTGSAQPTCCRPKKSGGGESGDVEEGFSTASLGLHSKELLIQRMRQMKVRYISVLVPAAFWLIGCAHISESRIPLDGSPVNDLSQVAQIVEDADYPALLRGVDGIPLKSVRVSNDFYKYVYLIKPGHHVFWLMNAPYGHPLVPQRIRCYVIQAELTQGTRYRLKEDIGKKLALLLTDDTGEMVSIGQLVDEPWVISRSCRWQ
jgi:hypothetical protein